MNFRLMGYQIIPVGDGSDAGLAVLQAPITLFLDSPGSGDLFLAESNRLRRIFAVNRTITTIAGNGYTGYTGEGYLALESRISSPSSVFVKSGEIFFTTNNRIQKINSLGYMRTIAGNGTQSFNADNILSNSTLVNNPSSLIISNENEIYFVDTLNYRIRKIDTNGIVSTICGVGVPGNGGDNEMPSIDSPIGLVTSMALDSENRILYFVDSDNKRIKRIDLDSEILYTHVGGGNSTQDKQNRTETELISVHSIAFSLETGALYYSEVSSDYSVIRRVYNDSVETVVGIGISGFNGDGILATSAKISSPKSILITSGEDIIFIDHGNNLVRKVFNSNGTISTITGTATSFTPPLTTPVQYSRIYLPYRVKVYGSTVLIGEGYSIVRQVVNGTISIVAGKFQSGSTTVFDGDFGTSTRLNLPKSIALDANGNVLIADFNNGVIRILYAFNQKVYTVGGTKASYGQENVIGTSTRYKNGCGFSYYNEEFYWNDSGNCRVLKLGTDGIVRRVAGTNGMCGFSGDGASALDAKLLNPWGLSVSPNGDIYIADSGNSRIRKVSGGIITTVAGASVAGYNGDNIDAMSAYLSFPSAVFATSDAIYIGDSENRRVRKVQISSGIITTVAGNGSIGDTGEGVDSTTALIGASSPRALFISDGNDLYYADISNGKTRVVSGGIVTTVAGSGTIGFTGDGGVATSAQFRFIYGMWLYGSALYIADSTNNVVRKVSNNIVTRVAGTGSPYYNGDGISALLANLNSANQVIVHPTTGELWILTSDRIRKVNSNGIISTVVGGAGDGALATNAQMYPSDVHVWNGTIYLADTTNHCVRKITSDGIISVVAGKYYAGFSGDHGNATDALLNTPDSVFVTQGGEIYISDTNNHRIRKIDSNGKITTIAGSGTSGFSGDGGLATAAKLNVPLGIYVSSNNDLYITDTGNHRIRKVSNGIITTIAGTGTLAYNGDIQSPTLTNLNTPRGVYMSDLGELYIADTSNNLIRKIKLTCPYGYYADSGTGDCVGEPSKCFGVSDNDVAVCSGHGVCNTNGSCICNTMWGGSECEISLCQGILATNQSVCSGHGNCSNGVCTCGQNFFGSDCSIPMCFGKLSSDLLVCSGNGICGDQNNCSCNAGYLATDCSVNVNPFTIELSKNESLSNYYVYQIKENSLNITNYYWECKNCGSNITIVASNSTLTAHFTSESSIVYTLSVYASISNIQPYPPRTSNIIPFNITVTGPNITVSNQSVLVNQTIQSNQTLTNHSISMNETIHTNQSLPLNTTVEINQTMTNESIPVNQTIPTNQTSVEKNNEISGTAKLGTFGFPTVLVSKLIDVSSVIANVTLNQTYIDSFLDCKPNCSSIVSFDWKIDIDSKVLSNGSGITTSVSSGNNVILFNPPLPISFKSSNVQGSIFTLSFSIFSKMGNISSKASVEIVSSVQPPSNSSKLSNENSKSSSYLMAVSPEKGVALSDSFSVSVTSWKAPSQILPLKYAIGFVSGGKDVRFTDYSLSTTFSVYLPYLSQKTRADTLSEIELYIYVMDTIGNVISSPTGVSVTVAPFNGTSSELVQKINQFSGTSLVVASYDKSYTVLSSGNSSELVLELVKNIQIDPKNPDTALSSITTLTSTTNVINENIVTEIANKLTSFVDNVKDLYAYEKKMYGFVKSKVSPDNILSTITISSNLLGSGVKSEQTVGVVDNVASMILLAEIPKILTNTEPLQHVSFTTELVNITVSSFKMASPVDGNQLIEQGTNHVNMNLTDIMSVNGAMNKECGLSMVSYTKNMNNDNYTSNSILASSINDFKFIQEQNIVRLNNLKHPIVLSFKLSHIPNQQNSSVNSTFSCRYWDEAEHVWSERGCQLSNIDLASNTIECSCTHTTMFTTFVEQKTTAVMAAMKEEVATLYFVQIALGVIYIIAASVIVIGLIVLRKDQPISSRLITPYVGMLALCTECLLIYIVQRSVLVSQLLSTTDSKVWEVGDNAANIIANVVAIVVNTLNLSATLCYVMQVSRFQFLKHMYKLMSPTTVSFILPSMKNTNDGIA